jgi:hypothetical protein
MNCQEVMELMQRHLDGDLHAQEEEVLEAHLMHCLDCALMFERLQRLSDELTQLPKVVPPYSLVDALLPQLGELDRHAAASITEPITALPTQAQSTAVGQSPRLPWTRRFGTQFSWKLAGGIVAAGLIIGFFAFNMKHPLLDQADGMLQPRSHSESSSMTQSAPAAGAADKKMMKTEDANNDTKAATPALEGKQDKADSSAVSSPQATTDAKLEKPKVMDPSATSKSPLNDPSASKMAPATSVPERLKDPASPVTEKDPAVKTPDPTNLNADKANTLQEEPKDANPLKTSEPTPSPLAKKAEPKGKADNTAGIFSFMAPPVSPFLKSASGTYEAFIEEQHVVIRDSSSLEVVFASKQVWQQSDEIRLVEWAKDDKLSYQVQSGDTSKTFVIDVKTMKELVP